MIQVIKGEALAKPAGVPIAIVLLLLFAQPGHAAQMRNTRTEALSQRLFPALTEMARWAPIAAGADSGAVANMLSARRQRMLACRETPKCLVTAAAWTTQERDQLASDAEQIFKLHVNPTADISDDGVRAEIVREVNGLNHILEVYGLGGAVRYPEIDGPGIAPGTPEFDRNMTNAVALADAEQTEPVALLDPSLELVLTLLDTNDADNAVAFEPIDTRYNASALARARTIDWSRYRYTAIIVPGAGPDDLATPLSSTGKLRVSLAAKRFFDGVAPIIIVTGSAVHPRGTTHVEALEMREALIDRYGVPADSVIVEPYARHTTTNLRNATRRLAGLGAPLDRDALIVTSAEQSKKIKSDEFTARNQQELGYQPGAVGERLSPTELVFRPSRASLRVDPMDPLDP